MVVKARIVKRKIADSILEEIRRMIVDGELKEGDKLPNQNEFSAQLGVSRPSLREAMQTLMQLGAIEQRPGYGTVLISSTPVLFTEHMALPLISDEEATIELVEARRVVEVGMVNLAVVKATEEDLKAIGEVLAQMEEAMKKGAVEGYRKKDLVYHYLVAQASHNRYVAAQFQNLRQVFEQFLEEAFSVMPDMLQYSYEDHLEIYQALLARDQARASQAMTNHIMTVEKAMKRFYKKRSSRA